MFKLQPGIVFGLDEKIIIIIKKNHQNRRLGIFPEFAKCELLNLNLSRFICNYIN